MGSFVKCIDVASMVIDEETSQLAPIWVLDKEKYRIFKQYCSAIDSIVEDFGGYSIDVEVDDDTSDIAITIECAELIVESSMSAFSQLAKRSVSFGFSKSDNEDLMNIRFVFPSVWNCTL